MPRNRKSASNSGENLSWIVTALEVTVIEMPFSVCLQHLPGLGLMENIPRQPAQPLLPELLHFWLQSSQSLQPEARDRCWSYENNLIFSLILFSPQLKRPDAFSCCSCWFNSLQIPGALNFVPYKWQCRNTPSCYVQNEGTSWHSAI